VSLKNRIRKLEDQLTPLRVEVPEDFDLDAEVKRWNAALEALAEMIDNTDAVVVVRDFLQTELSEVCWLVDEGPKWNEYKRRRLPEYRRWPDALVMFFGHLPQARRSSVVNAGALTENYTTGQSVAQTLAVQCCLPAFAHPARGDDGDDGPSRTVYTEQPEKVDTYAVVCDGCGLLRPKAQSTRV